MFTWGSQDTAGIGLGPNTKHGGYRPTSAIFSSCGSTSTTKPLQLLLLIGTEEAIRWGSGGGQHIPLIGPLS